MIDMLNEVIDRESANINCTHFNNVEIYGNTFKDFGSGRNIIKLGRG